MKNFMDWMQNSFAPKMNKLAHNPYIAGIQEAILTSMPMIFVGSFICVLAAFADLVPWMPDLWLLNTFSIGLLSVYLAYLIPSSILEKKHLNKTKREAGLAGIASYFILVGTTFNDDGAFVISSSGMGTGGMPAAIVSGIFVAWIMSMFAKHSFFKKTDSSIPDFITVWFDTLIPILIVITVDWLLVYVLNINMYTLIYDLFKPILNASDSFWGYTILYFVEYTFLYTFGISTWVLYPIESAIVMTGISANQAAVAAGQSASVINAYGTSYYWTLGGGGLTLALGLMMLFLAKSKKLKVIGKATIVPSLCNINEPVIFGAPVAFNPILMVPMWIIGFIGPALTWCAMHFNWIAKVSTLFSFWYLPFPICTFAIGGMRGLIFSLVIFAISWAVYYPFFKVYDKQCVEEEEKKVAEAAAKAEN